MANDESSSSSKYSVTQQQTKQIFGFKWKKRETYESAAFQAEAKRWLFERYCDNNRDLLAHWLKGSSKSILDAGCGSGFSALLFFGDLLRSNDYVGVDISDAVKVAEERFKEKGVPGKFIKTSLTELPFPDNAFDIIFSEGVLHHTDSTEESIKYLSKKLKTNGRFLFYVYAKKAAVREFTDDFVREKLKNLSDEEAWEALKPLTKLGMALGQLNVQIDVEEDIPFLGISKGKLDIQRFIYWNMLKLYYRPEFTLDEMNHINFDWYRPLNCHRHTPEEIQAYCDSANLKIEHMNVQEAGITVVAKRN